VITTNFDRVLEKVFAKNGQPFEVVVGGAQTVRIANAIRINKHYLLKIHGDVNESTGRILTKREYDKHYTDGPDGIPVQLHRIFTSRVLLFVGCGLNRDRTLEIMKSWATNGEGSHYAIVEKPADNAEFEKKTALLSNCKIRPIWYPHQRYELAEAILQHLISSVFRTRTIFGILKWFVIVLMTLGLLWVAYKVWTRPPTAYHANWEPKSEDFQNWRRPAQWTSPRISPLEFVIDGPPRSWGGPKDFDQKPLYDFKLEFKFSFLEPDEQPGTKLVWVLRARPQEMDNRSVGALDELDGYQFRLRRDDKGELRLSERIVYQHQIVVTEPEQYVGLHCCSVDKFYVVGVRVLGHHQDSCIEARTESLKSKDHDSGRVGTASFTDPRPTLRWGSVAFGSGDVFKRIKISHVRVIPLILENASRNPTSSDYAWYQDERLKCE